MKSLKQQKMPDAIKMMREAVASLSRENGNKAFAVLRAYLKAKMLETGLRPAGQ